MRNNENTTKCSIPVITENRDFYRYYSASAQYCNNCKCGYITKTIADEILRRIQNHSLGRQYIRLANVSVKYEKRNDQYLSLPTLGNKNAIFMQDFDRKSSETNSSGDLKLNAESFLYRMGYNVKKATQNGGERKYARAIRIWQNNKNNISAVDV